MRISQHRWFIAFTKDEVEDVIDAWNEWMDDNGDVTVSKESSLEFLMKFGIIPIFTSVYEVCYNSNISCLECNCGFWNRLHIP